MEQYFSYYKNEIDNFLNNNDYSDKYVYGGSTEKTSIKRKNEHIRDKDPEECNSNWKIKKITSLNITDELTITQYEKLVKKIENYLINKLYEKYYLNCKNAMKLNNKPKQTGGNGITVNQNDNIIFYIFYGI